MWNKNFWDFLAWLALIYIIIWTILKMTGVINTPVLIEYSPIFGAAYLGGRALSKLDRVVEDLKEIKKDLNILDKRVIVLETVVIKK